MQTKVILVKLGIKLMSFNLGKVTQPECPKPKQEPNSASPNYIVAAFNSHSTNIGQLLAREVPSVDTDPFSNVNPANSVSLSTDQCSKVIQLPTFINEGKATSLPYYKALSQYCKNKQ